MSMRSVLAACALVAVTATLAGALGGGVRHLHLVKSSPEKDERLSAPPRMIRLWFSERPEVNFTSVTLLRADSSRVPVSKTRPTDDTLSVAADITDSLPAGSYTVAWRSASRDGHAIRGRFGFTIAP